MGLRDLSILAHGFNPVSAEAYKDMLQLIQDSIITAIRELAKELPESERYLLRDQVSRAADSVCLKVRKEGTRL